MTLSEKIEIMRVKLDEREADDELFSAYLLQAKSKILNKMYPLDDVLPINEVPARYEELQIELAIVYYSQRGGEGEKSHNENNVNRAWRSESEILIQITPHAGLPL